MKKITIQNLAWLLFAALLIFNFPVEAQNPAFKTGRVKFNDGWKFALNITEKAQSPGFDDTGWRNLNLPHDWSIELPFDRNSPTGGGGGFLRGGLGWYRKTFTSQTLPQTGRVFIDFDGVYRNSEVWINGHYLGMRPYGYISFRYELTPYLKPAGQKNVIAVKVDNSKQPNSRWYSGSGIYRNVWLVTTQDIFVDHWGTQLTTTDVSEKSAKVTLAVTVKNTSGKDVPVKVTTALYDPAGKLAGTSTASFKSNNDNISTVNQVFSMSKPQLWSLETPHLYKAVTKIIAGNKVLDEYSTPFGIRYFKFDVDKGFFLNGKHVKIRGVCDHHDLGCLGAAINTRALERQVEILKGMGCNAIRTSHNPPAPELLDICDRMGMIVMDEAFDMWKKEKTTYDYHLDWDQWHVKDLTDMVKRDRNHPSVFIWSVGNEIMEQWDKKDDTTARTMTRELVGIVKSLDNTRPTITANNNTELSNPLLQANALDIIGYNYHIPDWSNPFTRWPRKPFLISESTSALQTRGSYDMPSDSIFRWPFHWDQEFKGGNKDLTCSAYDNCSAPWGSTHEETIKVFEKNDYIAGTFIWTGFDYIGEPTPYPWPARSSYFGIIDLAGFPKDVYYMYKSTWTSRPVLYIFPHWNWKAGQMVDIWAYYNNADQVELFLNGKSLGVKKKINDDLHVSWRVPFEKGTLKAISRKNGKVVLEKEIHTADVAANVDLKADRNTIKADGEDLSFVTVRILDNKGTVVPDANNHVKFSLEGEGEIVGVDNGLQTSMESFKASERNAFNGLCLVVIQSHRKAGNIKLTVTSEGLKGESIFLQAK